MTSQSPWAGFSPTELDALLTAAPCPWWRAFVSLGAKCGLRVREVLWLAWDDFDSSAAALTITSLPVVGDSAGDSIDRPQMSPHAERVVAIPGEVALDLRRLHDQIDNSPLVFLPSWKVDQLWLDLGAATRVPLDRLAPGISRDFRRIQRFARLRTAQHTGKSFDQTTWAIRPLSALRNSFIHTASGTMPPGQLAEHLGLANVRSMRRFRSGAGVEAAA